MARSTRRKSPVTVPANHVNDQTANVTDLININAQDNELSTITTKEALLIAHYYGKRVTIATLHKWLYTHTGPKLYHQPCGPSGKYYIFKLAFLRYIKGEEGT